jgi:hypothetical protein
MLSKIFKKIQVKNYQKGDFFAVTKGKYGGEFWVLININEKDYDFLSMPNMIRRNAPFEKLEMGINCKIIDFIQNIPGKVFKVCENQYKKVK